MDITRFLPKNEYDAAVGANTPSASNVFATMADIGGGTPSLSAVLAVGNTGTAGQNINLVGNAGVGGYIDIANGAGGAGPTCLDASLRIQSINTGAQDGETIIETTTCRPTLRHDIIVRTTTIGSFVKLQSTTTGDGIFKVVGNGEASFEATLTGTNRTYTFQDGDGTVAFLSDITVSAVAQTYTPTNVTTDRAFDANSTTLDEIADVVGTLITDLKTSGIIL
jgi:hypothetical protein